MLGIQTSTIKVFVAEDISDNMLDEIASDIELGINAIEERLKEKYPKDFDHLDWDME